MSSPANNDLREAVFEAAIAVGVAMATDTYAIVGGAGCVLLGCDRTTSDVDIVVPKGATRAARARFRASDKFTVESGTAHTYYNAATPFEIEILAPPGLFKEAFDATTPVMELRGVKVLKPALIFNAKCGSVLNRANNDKKLTDVADIKFLLDYFAKNTPPAAAEVPNMSKEFVEWFVASYGNEEKWIAAGYDKNTGESNLMVNYAVFNLGLLFNKGFFSKVAMKPAGGNGEMIFHRRTAMGIIS